MIDFSIEEYLKDKFIAFVDVLGFKDLVNKIEYKEYYDPTFHETDLNTFDAIQSFYKKVYQEEFFEKENKDLKITCISDSIIVSATTGDISAFINIVRFLFYLQNNLLCRDYDNQRFLTRGYLTKGKFIHDAKNNVIFGEAYQKAYSKEEEKEVVYPEIIIDKDIINEFENDINQIPLIKKEPKGHFFIDYLLRELLYYYSPRENIDDFCRRKMNEYSGNKKITDKYEWLLNYYEETKKRELTEAERKISKIFLGDSAEDYYKFE